MPGGILAATIMAIRSDRARVPLAGVAVAGVVAGHTLTYIVAVRQPGHRDAILNETGHSYWTGAVAAAIVLGVLAVTALGIRVARGAREPRDPHRFARVAPILAVGQVVAYAAIELVERILTHVPFSALLDHHELLPVGVAIQVGIALAGALALCLIARTIRLVAEALRDPRRRHEAPTWTPAAAWNPPVLRSRALRGAWGLRGPPAVAGATASR